MQSMDRLCETKCVFNMLHLEHLETLNDHSWLLVLGRNQKIIIFFFTILTQFCGVNVNLTHHSLMNNIPVSLYMYVLYRYTATLLTIIYYKYLRWCGGWIWWINAFIYTTETLHCSWIVMSNEQELNLNPPPPCISQTNYNYIQPNWIEMSYPICRGFTCRHT